MATKKKVSVGDRDKKTLVKIQRLAQDMLKAVSKKQNPAIEIRTRALSNVSFNEKKRIIDFFWRRRSGLIT